MVQRVVCFVALINLQRELLFDTSNFTMEEMELEYFKPRSVSNGEKLYSKRVSIAC